MSRAVNVMEEHRELFSQEFRAWLPKNLHIWDAFVEQTNKVIERGFKHYSSRTILHVLRHHSALVENGAMWKISDHSSPYLSRLWGLMNPSFADIFSTKRTPTVEKEQTPDEGEE